MQLHIGSPTNRDRGPDLPSTRLSTCIQCLHLLFGYSRLDCWIEWSWNSHMYMVHVARLLRSADISMISQALNTESLLKYTCTIAATGARHPGKCCQFVVMCGMITATLILISRSSSWSHATRTMRTVPGSSFSTRTFESYPGTPCTHLSPKYNPAI